MLRHQREAFAAIEEELSPHGWKIDTFEHGRSKHSHFIIVNAAGVFVGKIPVSSSPKDTHPIANAAKRDARRLLKNRINT